jgi:transposase-like protein
VFSQEDTIMGFPKTLQEFQAAFLDEEACWKALREARWPHGFVCPRCGSEASSWISTRRLEQCRRCRYQCSVTAGTVFHRTRLSLLTWFWAIFFIARHKKGISALQLQRDTGIGSYESAWTMLPKLRSALRHRPEDRLAGLVEVDETYVGGPERGRRGGREVSNKSIVSVAVEQRRQHAGRARLAVLQGVSIESDLGPFIQDAVDARAPRCVPMALPPTSASERWAFATTAGCKVPIGLTRTRSSPLEPHDLRQ